MPPTPQMFIPRKNWGRELDEVIKGLGPQYGKALTDELANYLHIQNQYNAHTHPGGSATRAATVVVQASDALHPEDGDFTATGTCDDVTINAALASLPTGGGRVLLSEGTFNLCAAIVIPKANVTLEGQGPSTVLKCTAATVVLTNTFGNFQLFNLRADGNGFSGSIHMFAGPFVINNVWMAGGINAGGAIQVALGVSFSDGVITECNITGYPAGIQWFGAHAGIIGNNIIKCTSEQIRLPGSTGAGGRCLVIGNHLIGGGVGVQFETLSSNGLWIVGGNIITGVAGRGIWTNVGASVTIPALIFDNLIFDCTGNGIEIFAASEMQIYDNFCLDNGGDGIHIEATAGDAANNNSVFDNRCRANTGWGVNVVNANANTNIVVGNDVRGNTAGTIQDTGTGTILTFAAGGAPGDNF